eukprot:4721404-Pleurochrysis_carterae.AAC.3
MPKRQTVPSHFALTTCTSRKLLAVCPTCTKLTLHPSQLFNATLKSQLKHALDYTIHRVVLARRYIPSYTFTSLQCP